MGFYCLKMPRNFLSRAVRIEMIAPLCSHTPRTAVETPFELDYLLVTRCGESLHGKLFAILAAYC